jgi:hypothetical protein
VVSRVTVCRDTKRRGCEVHLPGRSWKSWLGADMLIRWVGNNVDTRYVSKGKANKPNRLLLSPCNPGDCSRVLVVLKIEIPVFSIPAHLLSNLSLNWTVICCEAHRLWGKDIQNIGVASVYQSILVEISGVYQTSTKYIQSQTKVKKYIFYLLRQIF